jgi:hypothetical protein
MLKFNPNYREWKERFNTEPVFTRKQMSDALEQQKKELTVNRVIQSFTGRVGPDESIAMQILAIHNTPEGVIVIVR